MSNSRGHKLLLVLTLMAAAIGLGSVPAGCTAATPDVPVGGSGASASGSSPVGDSSASGVSSTSGSASTSGGTAASGSAASGSSGSSAASGATSGASSGATAGSGSSASGASSGAAGSGAAGSGSAIVPDGGSGGGEGGAGTGCAWIQDATGAWMFDPAAPNKVVLFDGTTLNGWHKLNQPGVPIQWKLNGDKTMTVVPSGTGQATEVQSDMKFENLCVHVEYMTPQMASSFTGQQRGNSGVYLKSAYEMQILDSYLLPPDINTCGAVYGISKPLVVACHQELVWNTYEIEFKSSLWSNANPPAKTANAEFIKVALNGKVVQLNVPLNPPGGFTQAGIPDAPGPQPLGLQDHLDLVSFRNVWVRVPQY